MEKVASSEITWTIENWLNTNKVVVAAEASCHVEVGDPKVGLRFFLRPKEKSSIIKNNYVKTHISRWYSLWAEVLTPIHQNAVIEVAAVVQPDVSDEENVFSNYRAITMPYSV